ncbi:MAG: hypothetical protein KAR19_13390 [Bacteroidales bacterium]|nr:hypothetical protein [Bacteroidales bacterium]
MDLLYSMPWRNFQKRDGFGFMITAVLLIIVLFPFHNAGGQTSRLVHPGQDGKLIYENYANRGEDTTVNILPDFSFAGYMGGGVPLPENIPVKITLEPSRTGDDRNMIQDAINQVSALSPDMNGFQGAVLLKKGLYKVNGPLEIKTAGVILKGEGQLPAANGGTELVAMAPYQHAFLSINGYVEYKSDNGIDPGTEIASFDYPVVDTWIVEDVTERVAGELSNDSVVTFVFYSMESGNFKFYSKENGDSSKIPYLEVVFYSEILSANDTINIYPSNDTYVRGLAEYRDTVYGHDRLVYYKKLDPEVARIGFIKFPLDVVSGTLSSARIHVMASREGQTGTNFIAYTENDDWLEETRTWNNTFTSLNQTKRIITPYVGTGSRSFVLEDASSFYPGDKIFVRRTPNQLWCDILEMSTLSLIDPECTDWTPESYTIDHHRTITDVRGDTIFIDIPLVDPMQDLYGGGEVLKDLTIFPVQRVGIENMYITSEYKFDGDEDHGWDAIRITNAKNCWVRNMTARYFGYSCVYLHKRSSFCTVQDCAMLDPKSLTEGGRKYPFPISGGGIGNLVQRCYAKGGRHSFATHSRVTGPHVFLDCYATDTHSDIGPHHRWAAGILYDNVFGGQIRVQNRWDMGTGHGWAGVQNMFWNCHSYKENFKVESPLGGMNWGIGCTAMVKEGDGFWESNGTPVTPRSLYLQQLKDRLGQEGLDNIATEDQQNNRIWAYLADWAGYHPTGIRETSKYLESISVYPNPADREIIIDLTALEGESVDVELIDMFGRIHYRERVTGGSIRHVSVPEGFKNQVVMLRFKGPQAVISQKIIVK